MNETGGPYGKNTLKTSKLGVNQIRKSITSHNVNVEPLMMQDKENILGM